MMTLKLSLSPALEGRLKAAASHNGKPPDEYAVQLLDLHLPSAAPNHATAQMLLSWAKEDETMTDAESAENEAVLRAIDADRLSDRKLFTHLLRGQNR